jgi:hypothetical protein
MCFTKDKTAMENQASAAPVMRSFTRNESEASPLKTILVFTLMALFGIGTGFLLAYYSHQTGTKLLPTPNSTQTTQGQTFGSDDTETFKDTAEGTLKEGGIDGEGQYHLVRPGGDSQNVYLTSSSLDLSQFVGKKIKVWGETQEAQSAGWLMDVGRVEIL